MALRSLSYLLLGCLLAVGCASVPVITPTHAASAPAAVSPTEATGNADSQATQVSTGQASDEPASAAVRLEQADEAAVDAPAVPDISRDDAIAQFSELAFISFSDASCVIDALHAEVGVYNFASEVAREQADQPALIDMCLSGLDPSSSQDDNVTDSAAGTAASGDSSAADPAKEFEAPVLQPGGVSSASVILAGRTVPYAVFTPAGFNIGDSAPVFIALQSDKATATEAAFIEGLFLDPAESEGWIVISPAPVGTWHDKRNGDVVAELVQWVDSWVDVEGGQPHLGGSATGAAAAFRIAASQPSAFQSVIAFPGFITSDVAGIAAKLAPLRIRMVAIDLPDSPWLPGMIETETALVAAGADVFMQVLTVDDLLDLDDAAYGRLIFDLLTSA